jgi:hypothetical protein
MLKHLVVVVRVNLFMITQLVNYLFDNSWRPLVFRVVRSSLMVSLMAVLKLLEDFLVTVDIRRLMFD